MFSRKKSPVKKKFSVVSKPKKTRRSLDPRTLVLIKQCLLGLLLIAVFVLLGVALWYGTRIEALTLRNVEVSGGETIDLQLVKTTVDQKLEGEYIGLIPRRFAWWYPADDIKQAVLSIPRLKDPELDRLDGQTVHLSFSEYVPHALWCRDHASNDCYFIDETGFAFTKAPQLSGGALLRFYTIGHDIADKTNMIATADLMQIENLISEVEKELGLPIDYVETDMMRDVFLGVSGGGEIKATLRMSTADTFTNLRTILAAKEFSDLAPGNFQYIDLRFGNKVFVNEEWPGTSTSTATTTEDIELPSDPEPESADSESQYAGTQPPVMMMSSVTPEIATSSTTRVDDGTQSETATSTEE